MSHSATEGRLLSGQASLLSERGSEWRIGMSDEGQPRRVTDIAGARSAARRTRREEGA